MDEDAVLLAIGGLTEAVKHQGREIGDLKKILQEDARSCRKCKEGIDARLDTIEEQHKGEKAVSSFLDTTIGRISTCIGILAVSASLIMAFVIPALLPFVKAVL